MIKCLGFASKQSGLGKGWRVRGNKINHELFCMSIWEFFILFYFCTCLTFFIIKVIRKFFYMKVLIFNEFPTSCNLPKYCVI